MKRFLVSLLLIGMGAPAFCQQASEDTMPPVAPAVPITPVVLPPDVPPRPPLISVPPAVAAAVAPDSLQIPQKESLAWRARAHKLRLSNNAQQQVLNANYDAAIMTLISALAQAGLRVQTLNSKAGELLAVPNDLQSKQRFIFVVAEMPPGTVTVKATAWMQSKPATDLLSGVLQSLVRTGR